MATAVVTSFEQICDANGTPLSAGSVKVCSPGTTTPLSVYSDAALGVGATNPINLTGARHDMRYIATGAYKIIVYSGADGTGTTLYTRDNIDPGVPIGTGALAIANGGTGATTAEAALAAIGAATAAELAEVTAEVASISGALGSTEKTHLATGTTAQRPDTPVAGDVRHNTTTSKFEGYIAAWWNFLTTADIASQSNQETATSTTTVVTPGRQHFHPTAAKAWGIVTWSGGTPTLRASHNIASITDQGTGDITFTFSTSFSSAFYSVVATAGTTASGGSPKVVSVNATGGRATGSCRLRIHNSTNGTDTDPEELSVAFFGDF